MTATEKYITIEDLTRELNLSVDDIISAAHDVIYAYWASGTTDMIDFVAELRRKLATR